MQTYYRATDPTVKNKVYLMEAVLRGPSAVLFAYRTARALERGVSNPEMMGKMLPAIQSQAEGHFAEFHAESDRDLMEVLWKMYAKNISLDQQPRFIKNVGEVGGDFKAYADHIYATSIYMNEERFKAFLANPDSATLANDPLTKVANDSVRPTSAVKIPNWPKWMARPTVCGRRVCAKCCPTKIGLRMPTARCV